MSDQGRDSTEVGRRQFLRRGAALGGAALLGPGVFLRPLRAAPPLGTKNLVVVELFGGNDGLNTIVPWAHEGGVYKSLWRPNIGIPSSSVLKIPGQTVGFHPALAPLKSHYDAGRLAVIQGVSSPDASFSHELARRIWYSGDPTSSSGDGWLGRYLAKFDAPAFPVAAEITKEPTQIASGAPGVVPAMKSPDDFVFPGDPLHPHETPLRRIAYARMAAGLSGVPGAIGKIAGTAESVLDLIDTFQTVPPIQQVAYPSGPFAAALRTAVRLMVSGVGMRYFHVALSGFDTHGAQPVLHANLLGNVAASLAAFHADLVLHGINQDTVAFVFSEFGRTIEENANLGTDHGGPGPAFAFGDGVNGGVYGSHPSLLPGALSELGEPVFTTDMRDVIGTVLMRWLGESQSSAGDVLHGHLPTDLGFIA